MGVVGFVGIVDGGGGGYCGFFPVMVVGFVLHFGV